MQNKRRHKFTYSDAHSNDAGLILKIVKLSTEIQQSENAPKEEKAFHVRTIKAEQKKGRRIDKRICIIYILLAPLAQRKKRSAVHSHFNLCI